MISFASAMGYSQFQGVRHQREVSFACSSPAHDPAEVTAVHGWQQHSALSRLGLDCHSGLLEHTACRNSFPADPGKYAH